MGARGTVARPIVSPDLQRATNTQPDRERNCSENAPSCVITESALLRNGLLPWPCCLKTDSTNVLLGRQSFELKAKPVTSLDQAIMDAVVAA